MHVSKVIIFVVSNLLLSIGVCAQDLTVKRDPQALAILQKSFLTMGGTIPTDAAATGNVTTVAGSKSDGGTIRILIRGVDQYSEEIQAGDATKKEVFSKGESAQGDGTLLKKRSLEWSANSNFSSFPIQIVGAALSKTDFAAEYVGLEQDSGMAVHHLRVWDTYASRPKLQSLSRFSVKDIWFDAATGLLQRLAFERREAGGAVDGIQIDLLFSDYRNVAGVLQSFHIEKSLNGTPWATIQLQSVVLNSGLSDSEFSIN